MEDVSNKSIKRIAVLTTADFVSLIGGAEVAIKEITERLPNIQFDFYCARIKKEAKKEERVGNVLIKRLGFGLGRFDAYFLALFGSRYVTRAHKKENYDLVWSVMASYGGFAGMFFKGRYPKVPFLLTLQEGDPVDHIFKRLGVFRQLFFKIFKRADAIQAISTYLAGWKSFGYQGDLVRVIPNGVSLRDFQKEFSEEKKNSLRNSLGIESGTSIVVTISRLERKNAVDVLIEAFSIFTKENHHTKAVLVVIGEGSMSDELKNLATEKGVKDKVMFLSSIPNKKIPQYLSIADVFARPSRSEGLGISFLEALASGVPIIGTSVGGIPDFLEDEETGLLCLLDNPKDLALKIEKLLYDEELSQKIVANGRKMIEEKYSWDKIAKDMEQMFIDTKEVAKNRVHIDF